MLSPLGLDDSSSVKHGLIIGVLCFLESPIILKIGQIHNFFVFAKGLAMQVLGNWSGLSRWGFVFVLLASTLIVPVQFAAAAEPSADPSLSSGDGDTHNKALVDDKYSLKADREAFDKLRKDIPADVRKENDEKAFMDGLLTSDFSRTPSEVRSKFSSIIGKKRELFQKDMTKQRETFSNDQRKAREEYSKNAAEKRKEFAKAKTTSDERTEFFKNLEAQRKNFYEAQNEKRNEFEANARDKRKDFDDYIRSKTDEFNQLHRDYTKRYEENKKAVADQKKAALEKSKNLQKSVDQEYEEIRKKPATPLEAGE